jgi:orotate phosphoribosyltransferase
VTERVTTVGDVRARLLTILRERALLRGEFVLSSGARSSYYLDARLVTLSSAGSPLVGKVFLDALPPSGIDGVAGLTVGADPIVTAIALTAGLAGRNLDAFIVRKQRKEHGAGRLIEGPWKEGVRVAVVDDTLTTGASSLEAAQAVEEAGGHVAGIYALIDREQGARSAIERAGYPFTALFTASEVQSES